MQNETNLYLKNLKASLTKDQLQTAFAQYGPVTSCDLRFPVISGEMRQPSVSTQFAFVNFANKEDAKNVQIIYLPNLYRHSSILNIIKLFYHSSMILNNSISLTIRVRIDWLASNKLDKDNSVLLPKWTCKTQVIYFNTIFQDLTIFWKIAEFIRIL